MKHFNLLSLQEAMDVLGVSRATIDRWRKDKLKLPHLKIGKEVFVDKQLLEAWIKLHLHLDPAPASSAGAPLRPEVISVGYQSGAALLWSPIIIKQLKLFEEELHAINPGKDYRVRWVNAPNGIELVEELIAGRVHIASVGDYPMIASRALGRLLPKFRPLVLAFDGKSRNGGGISLVVPPGSPIRRPEELAETTISTVGNSSASHRLNEWTRDWDRSVRPVTLRRMGDCLNSLVEGSVGASVLWEPYLSWAQMLGAGIPILPEGLRGDYDYLTGLVTDRNWTEGNEDAVIAYLKAHLRAHEFIRHNPLGAAQLVSEASGFPIGVVSGVLRRIRWDASFYSKDMLTLRRLEDDQAGWLPSIREEAGGPDEHTRFLQEAVEALKLPMLPDAPLLGDWSNDMVY